MNLQQMRYVVAVAETNSFTRAAERCRVVQSALSHQVARLERELGAKLFERTSRRCGSPRRAWRSCRWPASAWPRPRAAAEVAAAVGEVRGPLTVGLIPTVAAVDIPAQCTSFGAAVRPSGSACGSARARSSWSRSGRARPHRSGSAHRGRAGRSSAAPQRAEPASDLHRLAPPALLCRTRRRRRKGSVDDRRLGRPGSELSRAMRDVLLGADPPVTMTRRAVTRLAREREERSSLVHPGGNVVVRGQQDGDLRWWTWAGFRANATLAATLAEVVDPAQRFDDSQIRLRKDLTRDEWLGLVADAAQRLCLPEVNQKALDGLTFSDALSERLAMATLASRLADPSSAAVVRREPTRFIQT